MDKTSRKYRRNTEDNFKLSAGNGNRTQAQGNNDLKSQVNYANCIIKAL